ncbi:hypothetical protein GCM10017744_103590 [Streptomyces antimycoticus]|uniref:Uncharacterized protein n=1 Tax=Streptomyces antimycoticus TaxID=68175 RepID=A0A4D4KTA2_9ACTN|nr:hypothetical protein SANT12839_099650 [Streptomyces antimycoticus]
MTTTSAVAEPDPMRRPDALRLATDLRRAEDELRKVRGQLREAVDFVHDPTYDLAARQALARRMGVHEPSCTLTVPAAVAPQPVPNAVPAAR